MNLVKLFIIILVILGISCKKYEELSFCDFDFMIGKWDVSVVKKKENISTHTIVGQSPFNFLLDNRKYTHAANFYTKIERVYAIRAKSL